MKDVIKRLRELTGYRSDDYEESIVVRDEMNDIINSLATDVREVGRDVEEASSWAIFVTTVYEVREEGEVMYVEVIEEIQMGEPPYDGGLAYEIHEVFPEEVMGTRWVRKR